MRVHFLKGYDWLPFQVSLRKHTDFPAAQSCSLWTCRCIFLADTGHQLGWWRRSSCCSLRAFPLPRSEPEASAVDKNIHSTDCCRTKLPFQDYNDSWGHLLSEALWIRRRQFTSAFIPTILLGAAAAPRMKAPGSSSSFDTVFMLYSWQ